MRVEFVLIVVSLFCMAVGYNSRTMHCQYMPGTVVHAQSKMHLHAFCGFVRVCVNVLQTILHSTLCFHFIFGVCNSLLVCNGGGYSLRPWVPLYVHIYSIYIFITSGYIRYQWGWLLQTSKPYKRDFGLEKMNKNNGLLAFLFVKCECNVFTNGQMHGFAFTRQKTLTLGVREAMVWAMSTYAKVRPILPYSLAQLALRKELPKPIAEAWAMILATIANKPEEARDG